ncbi:flagellar hook-basal body complex protein [Jannaschia seohaensis]|uniref:Flagellar basal-body rod protein FlgF n=1 Tax=Jannaschia seohaensis TaxID=475081 RepID=A0A2Y9AXT8_9RHOB|nr:flagellar hook-basal body complex protein [Jannaschia seohaensis]PWJ16153.1 flagellar basal-body rod protein FlgF [Jannaschia seohaensis]SSA49144.1 flagellar basal-body rod protein FlgF [Jannaschia seohaensis]
MSDAIYTTLGRQSGLAREIGTIAQNVANASTTGYRAGGILFSEHVVRTGWDQPSISMSRGGAQLLHLDQGALEQTGGALDLAIEGEGFFLIDRGGEPFLTRAGAFVTGPDGGVTTASGEPLLDQGGAPVFVPAGTGAIHVGGDGTLSADGAPVAQIAIVRPLEPDRMERDAGTAFRAEAGFEPVEVPRVLHGFLEASNVDPVLEIARMIAVQHAYEMGQDFMEKEDERLRSITRLFES